MLASMGFAMPYGLLMAAAAYALPTRRHMHLYGTTTEQLGHDRGDLPRARQPQPARRHARRKPMTLERTTRPRR